MKLAILAIISLAAAVPVANNAKHDGYNTGDDGYDTDHHHIGDYYSSRKCRSYMSSSVSGYYTDNDGYDTDGSLTDNDGYDTDGSLTDNDGYDTECSGYYTDDDDGYDTDRPRK